MHTTPVSLLERLRQPEDQAAWERFVELYTPLLYSWTRRQGMPPEEAADLVQDLFLLLVEQLPQFRYDPTKSFHAWLRTVFLNKWRNHQRRRSRGAAAAGGIPISELPVYDPEAIDEAEYRQQLVSRALGLMQAGFEPATWQACWEFVAVGRPAEEVARSLGISRNAVYIAKSRVLRRLREELLGLLD
jgi:RNA polymerase sigma-70 factor (ECF subfamily)